MYGTFQSCLPSRFVDELPANCYEIINNYGSYYNRSKYLGGKKTNVSEYLDDHVPQDFAADASQESSVSFAFHKGQKVQHSKFGFGIILSVHDEVAEIAFYKHGMKKIMVEFLKAG
jgi:DNA helicase-2/ATP-dependent DNA helicase PcrA